MSDDLNVLAGLEGLVTGINSVASPLLTRKLQLQDLYQVESAKAQADLERQKQLEAYKQGLKPGRSVYLKSEIVNMRPSYRAALPHDINIVDDTNKDSGLSEKEQKQQDKLEKEYRDLHIKHFQIEAAALGNRTQK